MGFVSNGLCALVIVSISKVLFVYVLFIDTMRSIDRRKKVFAVLLSRPNQLVRTNAAIKEVFY